jgi:hypothetical protein
MDDLEIHVSYFTLLLKLYWDLYKYILYGLTLVVELCFNQIT